MNETVTIPKSEYDSLVKDRKWLQCLEKAGEEYFGGFDFARELLSEEEYQQILDKELNALYLRISKGIQLEENE